MNSGMLRRKRGADFDLSDSDDDIEARRRMKQREFAKMRKALLADENIGKIAENPKKLAFLRAIEDREKDDDLDFLDQPEETSQTAQESQSQGNDEDSQTRPAEAGVQHTNSIKRKRPLEESFPDAANRAPPSLRRSQNRDTKSKKPSSLAEIRESLSFLIEEPHAPIHALDVLESSDIEEDKGAHGKNPDHDYDKDKNLTMVAADPFATRNHRRTGTNPIIDRIELKRAASAQTHATSHSTRLAFHDPSTGPAVSGFRIPSLLRRATTQITAAVANNHGITTATERSATDGGGSATAKAEGVRRGGSKKSSINYFARQVERLKGVEERGKAREVGRLRAKVEGERRGFVGVLSGDAGWEA